jgi:ribosome-associated protein
MDIRKLQRTIVDGLEDVKAQNIVVFNTEHLSPLFERVIIASGTSNRQTKSLAASVRDAVKAAGLPPPRVEGEANGEWIIVDCGAAVVHVMQPSFRDYYHLEELWGDKPVKMKLQTAAVGLPKAAAPAAPSRVRPLRARTVSDDASPARKTAVRGPTSRSSSGATGGDGKRTSPRTADATRSAPVQRAPGAKRAAASPRSASPSRTAAPPRSAGTPARGVTRTVGVKSSAAKKVAAPARSTRRKPPTKT